MGMIDLPTEMDVSRVSFLVSIPVIDIIVIIVYLDSRTSLIGFSFSLFFYFNLCVYFYHNNLLKGQI